MSQEKDSGEVRLQFTLPGTWYSIDIDEEGLAEDSIRSLVEDVCGTTDEAAKARALMRQRLREACSSGAEAGAQAMYIGKELMEEVPLPVSITVYQPGGFRMSPAVGYDSQEVLEVLKLGFESGDEVYEEIEGLNYLALRFITVEKDDSWTPVASENETPEEQALRLEAEQLEFHTLRVDYWCHVPGSKRIAIVSFSTQLSEIENVMISLFDTIISASCFVGEGVPLPSAPIAYLASAETVETSHEVEPAH